MKIKEINDILKMNIICTNKEETEECFSIIEKLGLKTISNEFSKNNECREHNDRDIIINFNMNRGKFINQHSLCLYSCFRKNINFYEFKKETKKFLNPTSKESLQVEEKAMIDYIKNNKVAINCPTEDDYKKLIKMLDENGERWCDGDIFSKENIYYDYKDESCISYFLFNEFRYGDISFYKNGFKILTVQELFDKFKIEKKEESNIVHRISDSVDALSLIFKELLEKPKKVTVKFENKFYEEEKPYQFRSEALDIDIYNDSIICLKNKLEETKIPMTFTYRNDKDYTRFIIIKKKSDVKLSYCKQSFIKQLELYKKLGYFNLPKVKESSYISKICIDPNFSMEVIDKDRVDTVGDIILDNEDFIIIKK